MAIEILVITSVMALISAGMGYLVYRYGAKMNGLEALWLAVHDIGNTYVDDIKKASEDGTLTEDEKAAARTKAINKALELATGPGLRWLQSQGEHVLKAWIERFVAARNK